MSYNTWKMFQGIFEMLFLSAFLYVTILVYNWDDLGTKFVNLSVLRAIRRKSENIDVEILLHRQAIYTTKKEKLSLLIKSLSANIFSSNVLFPNPRILHPPLDVQVLVLIVSGRYIYMKKKTHHHHLLCKFRLWTLMWNLEVRGDPLDINC